MTDDQRHVKTKAALADALGISRQALYKSWITLDDFPAKGEDGWDVVECREFVRTVKSGQAGEGGGWRARKLELECEKLELQNEKARGDSVSIADMRSSLAEHGAVVTAVFDQFLQDVMVVTRDPRVVKNAKDAVRRARELLASKLEEL